MHTYACTHTHRMQNVGGGGHVMNTFIHTYIHTHMNIPESGQYIEIIKCVHTYIHTCMHTQIQSRRFSLGSD